MQRAVSYFAAVVVIVAVVAGVQWASGLIQPAAFGGLVTDGAYVRKATPVGADGPLGACVVCHSVESGGAQRVAPPLYGIVGAPKARAAWYGYSHALKTAGGTWTETDLDAFLTSPSKTMPGTTMIFSGVSDPKQRAQIIAALKANSDAH